MFTDIYFVFLLLPILLILLRRIPAAAGKWVLIIAGAVIYLICAKWMGLILVLTVLVNYGFHQWIAFSKKKRGVTGVAVIVNIAILAAAKITGYMPLGISFVIFQLISLLVDAGDEIVPFADYLIMTMFFPKIFMGPIVRYSDIKPHLRIWIDRRLVRWDNIEAGVKLYTAGLFLKVVIADNLASLWNSLMIAGVLGLSTPTAWLGAISYSLELYFDFWGYSLMAMAAGQMFGIPLARNFNEPYSATSIGDFWRRWHITLGTWFRDYVYIPLGGSKKGAFRTVLNLFAVWLLTGLWHGITLNFIIWGMFMFVLIVLERFTPLGKIKNTKVLCHIYLVFTVVISWVIFALTDINDLWLYIKCMFGIYAPDSAHSTQQFFRLLRTYWYLVAGGIVLATPLAKKLYYWIFKRWYGVLVLMPLLALCAFFMVRSTNNVFMYYAF